MGAVGALAATAAPAPAQVTPPPGTVAAPPTREEINRLPESRPAPRSRLSVTGGIERGPCPLDAPRFAAITFPLKDVVFDGLAGVDPQVLRASYAGDLGRTVPIATVCGIRDAATAILRRQGYLAAVEVPPQRIEDGVVHLNVVLARLVAIHVRGDVGHAERRIAAYLEGLKTGQPFNQVEAERTLLLAGDLPGFEVRLALRPAGTAPGEVIGDVVVARTPISATLNIQNFGSHSVGRWSALASIDANDVLGLGDRLTLGYYNTFDLREQHVVQSAYEMRPGTSGLTLGARFTYAWTRPDLGGGDPFRSRTLVASAEATYSLIRRQAQTLRGAGGLDIVSQKLRLNSTAFTNDQLRVLYARLDYSLIDPASIGDTRGYSVAEPRYRLSGSLEVRKGLGALGASDDCGPAPLYVRCDTNHLPSLSRQAADPSGALIRLGGTAEFRPSPVIGLSLSPRAQYGFDPLLSYEQFSAGNYTVGRGYDPGAEIGDSGVGFQGEVRYGKLAPAGPKQFAFQPFVFFDAAWIWNHKPSNDLPGSEHLYSIGGGLRAAYGDRARLDMTLAAPLTRTPFETHRRDVRFLVNFTTRLAP